MKFCYLDETGTGQETVVIFVGVVVDAQRMHLTKREWNAHLQNLSRIANREVPELHTSDLYSGNRYWRHKEDKKRTRIIEETLTWFVGRKHKVTFSAVCKTQFDTQKDTSPICQLLRDYWHTAAFHTILSLQKAHQSERKKGHSVLVFDRGKGDKRLPDLLLTPPDWSDTYYECNREKEEPLNMIVDIPFFGDSKHIALIQVADLIGFILRRYSDLHDYGYDQQYPGELDRISGWVEIIVSMLYDTRVRYPKRGRCPTADVFYNLAPESLREL